MSNKCIMYNSVRSFLFIYRLLPYPGSMVRLAQGLDEHTNCSHGSRKMQKEQHKKKQQNYLTNNKTAPFSHTFSEVLTFICIEYFYIMYWYLNSSSFLLLSLLSFLFSHKFFSFEILYSQSSPTIHIFPLSSSLPNSN